MSRPPVILDAISCRDFHRRCDDNETTTNCNCAAPSDVLGATSLTGVAKAHGCDHAIVYTDGDFVKSVRDITGGIGVHAVYDGVGKDTFHKSLDCIGPRGIIVSVGKLPGRYRRSTSLRLRQEDPSI
jgi:hypothetical protein